MKGTATLALVLLAAACGRAPAPPATADSAPPAGPADSLVLALPDGGEVWLVAGREGRGAGGVTCVERSVELRRDGRRKLVPLLFVRAAPRLEGTRLVATLSTNCADVADYVIDPATAYPTRRGGGR